MTESTVPASSPRSTDTNAAGQRAAETTRVPPDRTWTITTRNGYMVQGYLPRWAKEDPSQADIPPGWLPTTLHDIIHRAPFDGQLIHLARGGYGPGEQAWVLTGNIECIPDTDDGSPPLPVANIHLLNDYWLTGLGPTELAVFAAQLRAQADLLSHEIRPRLAAYRAEWSAHYSKPTLQARVPRSRV